MTDNRQGWYAVHVGVGREEAMASRISRVLQGCGLEEAFFPKFEVEQKFHGEWKRVLKPLWPGYIIVATRLPDALVKGCAELSEHARIIEVGDKPAALVSPAAELIRAWTRPDNRVVPLSTGMKEGNRMTVLQGPLVGNEHLIESMDCRKGITLLGVDGLDGKGRMRIGLRVLPGVKISNIDF